MNRVERVKAALESREVDRVPVSAWRHFSHVDQDPRSLAEVQVRFNEKYDYDFIKLMPFGTYSIQDWGAKLKIYCDKYKEPIVVDTAIKKVDDWNNIRKLSGVHGNWGKQLQLAEEVVKLVNGKTPVMQTIFSPLTTAKKLAGDRLINDMEENPDLVHHALKNITATTIDFVEKNIEAGVNGFFFATQCASYDVMDEELFREFGQKYDLQVIKSYKDITYFNVVHMHGNNIMFDIIKNYPVNCLNWHDRHTKPSLSEARKMTDKCLLGGIREVPYFVDGVLHYDSVMANSTEEEIKEHVQEALNDAGTKGIMIGPGCVADPKTSEKNLHAIRSVIEKKAVTV